MAGVSIGDPRMSTPAPTERWRSMTEMERLEVIAEALAELTEPITIIKCDAQGRIMVAVSQQDILERGRYLMKIEALLQAKVDAGLTVFLEAKRDENKLRWFRGVQPT